MFKISYLSFKNNFSKLYFPFFTMFFAAFLMTGSLSFQSGHLTYEALGYRQALGGDILIYTEPYIIDDPGDEGYVFANYGEYYTDLNYLLPRLPVEGYIKSQRVLKLDEITQIEQVTSLRPSLIMPVKVGDRTIMLRGRNIADDIALGWDDPRYSPLMTYDDSRYFTDEDELVCLAPRVSGIETGQQIYVQLPAIKYNSAGQPFFDFTSLTPITLTVIGTFQVSVGQLIEQIGVGGEDSFVRPLYWDPGGILISDQTWHRLYQVIGGQNVGELSEHLNFNNQLVIKVADTIYARDIIRQIQSIDPQLSVVSTADLGDYLRLTAGQGGPALSMDNIFVFLVFAVAGLIVSSNMYLSVMKRRREIGVLKALGANKWVIVLMILIEVVLISLAGSMAGFIFVRAFITIVLAVNRISLAVIATLSLQAFLQVVGVTTVLGVLFGLIPAFKAANLPVMEVLRNE